MKLISSLLLFAVAYSSDPTSSSGDSTAPSAGGDADGQTFASAAPPDGGDGSAAAGGDGGVAPVTPSASSSSRSGSEDVRAIQAPPLGQNSEKMQKWTPSSILASVGQNNEDTAAERFALQNALIASAPETNASMAGLQVNADQVKTDVLNLSKQLVNITTILNADASAGGMLASSRSLMNEMPATKDLLTKAMDTQMTNLRQNSVAMKQAIQTSENTYKTQMKALGDTVASLIVQQDAAYARQAAAQARAMNRTAQGVGQRASSQIGSVNSAISKNATTLNKIASSSSQGLGSAKSALNDASDALGGAETQTSQVLQQTETSVEAAVDAKADQSTNAMYSKTDQVTVSAEQQAMAAGRQLDNGLAKLDTMATKQVNGLLAGANRNSSQIASAVSSAESKNSAAIDKTVQRVADQVGGIADKATAVTADGSQVAQDAQAMLAKQQAAVTDTSSGFQTDYAKLQSLVSGKMSAAAQGAKSTSQDILGGTSDESQRLMSILSYLVQSAGAGTTQMSGSTNKQLSTAQQVQAAALARSQSAISDAQNQLAATKNAAQNRGIQSAGDLAGRVAGVSSTYGGSISDLSFALGDGSSSARDSLSQIGSALSGQASSAFSDVMEALRGVNSDTADGQEGFVSSILGPHKDSQSAQFAQLLSRLQGISGTVDGQSGSQSSAMDTLKAFQSEFNSQLGTAGGVLINMATLNQQAAEGVGNQGDNGLAAGRAAVMAALFAQMNAAQNSSADGLGRMDQLINSLVGGSNAQNQQTVGQTFELASTNLNEGSSQFSQAAQSQLKSLSGLRATSISMLGQFSNQAQQDTAETSGMLTDSKKEIIDRFKAVAANTTSQELGSILSALSKSGNDSQAVSSLLQDVQSALGGVDSDAGTARDAAAQKRAQFSNYISQTSGELQRSQGDIIAQLTSAIDDFENELAAKTALISSSQDDMNQTLANMTDKVSQAQHTLADNLAIYQDKIEGIIGQIRSYMNLSQNADELAISQDISNQLGKVNATEVAVAGANAAVSIQIAKTASQHNATGDSTYVLLNNLINGAVNTQASVSDGHVANTDELTAIAAGVDSNSNDLQKSLQASASQMQTGIADSSSTSASAITASEAHNAKSVDQVNAQAAEVASQSRKSFIANLQKMGGVDDDTSLVTQQLSQLLDSANGSIDDISESALSHLDLNTRTLAKLNAADVRKVASVSDVMAAFSNIVTSFLNETGGSMETVMNKMNFVGTTSVDKLKQIDVRSTDERNWLNSGINATSDNYQQIIDQERIIQSGLQKSLMNDEKDFSQYAATKESEISDIQDAVSTLQQQTSQGYGGQVTKVQSWINSRNPKVAQSLFGAKSASFLQGKSRESIIRDIKERIQLVEADSKRLRGVKESLLTDI